MSASKKKFHYTVAKVLHWVAAVMIIFMLLSDGVSVNFQQRYGIYS